MTTLRVGFKFMKNVRNNKNKLFLDIYDPTFLNILFLQL